MIQKKNLSLTGKNLKKKNQSLITHMICSMLIVNRAGTDS